MTTVLAGALGLVIGLVIGTLGGGGGILAVPALVYLLGQDARTATTGSVLIVGVISVAGVLARLRARTVDWRTGLAFGLVGIPAAWAGSLVNRAVAQPVLLLSFAVLTLAVGAIMMVRDGRSHTDDAVPGTPAPAGGQGRETAVVDAPRRARLIRAVEVVASGAVVGFLTGFLGVGGGFLVVPALTMVLGLSMPLAVGTSLLVIALNSVSSITARVGHIQLDWAVVLPFTVVAILGALAGKLVADRLSSATLHRGFAVLLILVGGFVGIKSLIHIGIR